jgi:hypothetical protein
LPCCSGRPDLLYREPPAIQFNASQLGGLAAFVERFPVCVSELDLAIKRARSGLFLDLFVSILLVFLHPFFAAANAFLHTAMSPQIAIVKRFDVPAIRLAKLSILGFYNKNVEIITERSALGDYESFQPTFEPDSQQRIKLAQILHERRVRYWGYSLVHSPPPSSRLKLC